MDEPAADQAAFDDTIGRRGASFRFGTTPRRPNAQAIEHSYNRAHDELSLDDINSAWSSSRVAACEEARATHPRADLRARPRVSANTSAIS
jgi:phosphate starvation-inducible PhoH-like protein